MTYPALTDLRLEIEDDPTGLVNLVQNPSGELGGWGWVTPVAGSSMGSDPNYGGDSVLVFTAPTPAAPTHFTTEPLPIAAGQYAAAAFALMSVGLYIRVRFEWLNSSQVLLSSSTQSGYLNTLGQVNYGPIVAPASTAYVRLRIDQYSTTGGANPTAGHTVRLREVTVAKAATSGALGTVRTNLIKNPSIEVNTTGWASGNAFLARVTSPFEFGAASLRATFISGAPAGPYVYVVGSNAGAVEAGKTYTFSVYVRDNGTKHGRVRLSLGFQDAANGAVGSTTVTGYVTTTGSWQRLTVTATAPPGAVAIRPSTTLLGWHPDDWGDTDVAYMDGWMLEQASSAGTYFDGSTADAGGWDYAWTGTAHNSTSTASSSNLAFIEPVPYLDVIGPTGAITIERAELNISTLEATIEDSALDPSDEDLIRPGKRVRLVTIEGGHVLFTGKVLNAKVAYNLLKDTTQIVLTAIDNVSVLAQASRTEGVATIAELPYVLEGAGVPWNVNGSGSQVPTATVVTTNENAKAIDQVAITRDSQHGYAWVDRFGVLQVWDADEIDTSPAGTLDEDDYNANLDVSFDTDRCINEITIKHLRVNLATGETVEVPYGPYRDTASIDEWDVHSAEFTVQGLTDNDATMSAFADEVFAANGTPEVRINSIQVPITSVADLTDDKALVDLYTLLTVSNATHGPGPQTARVTSIRHEIRAGWGWLITLGFSVEGGVAAPQQTPPVANAPGVEAGTWTNLTITAPWTAIGAQQPQYKRDEAGNVHLRGAVTRNAGTSGQTFATLPAGFRPLTYTWAAVVRTNSTTGFAVLEITTGGALSINAVGAFTAFGIETTFPALA